MTVVKHKFASYSKNVLAFMVPGVDVINKFQSRVTNYIYSTRKYCNLIDKY